MEIRVDADYNDSPDELELHTSFGVPLTEEEESCFGILDEAGEDEV